MCTGYELKQTNDAHELLSSKHRHFNSHTGSHNKMHILLSELLSHPYQCYFMYMCSSTFHTSVGLYLQAHSTQNAHLHCLHISFNMFKANASFVQLLTIC